MLVLFTVTQHLIYESGTRTFNAFKNISQCQIVYDYFIILMKRIFEFRINGMQKVLITKILCYIYLQLAVQCCSKIHCGNYCQNF